MIKKNNLISNYYVSFVIVKIFSIKHSIKKGPSDDLTLHFPTNVLYV